MDHLLTQNKKALYVFLFLAFALIILYMCNCIYDKKEPLTNPDCNCNYKPIASSQPPLLPQPTQNAQKDTITLYYANWCPHCKHFLPEWKKFESLIGSSDLKNRLNIEDYECDQHRQICQRANVPGFPTVILNKKNGSVTTYNGERTAEALLQFYAAESHTN